MEKQVLLEGLDNLKALADNPRYSFLKDKDLSRIQKDYREINYPFGTVRIQTLASEPEGKLNEDAPIVLNMGKGRELIAVLDGASSQKPMYGLNKDGISGAFFVSHLLSMGFETTPEYKDLCDRTELSAKDIMIEMNKWIYGKIKDIEGVDYTDAATVPGMAAAFVLIDEPNKRLSLAQVADSKIAAVKANGEIILLTPNLNEKFDKETMEYVALLAKNFNVDIGHVRQIPEAKELIRLQLADSFRRKTNKVGGCGVMNGSPEMASNSLIYSEYIPLDGSISSLLLYTDGVDQPYSKDEASMQEAAIHLSNSYYSNNEKPFLEKGAEILNSDPKFEKIPRLKKRDDALIVEIRLK